MFIHGAIEDATPQTANGAFPYLIPLPCLRLPSSVVDAVNLGRDNELLLSAAGAASRLIPSPAVLRSQWPSLPPRRTWALFLLFLRTFNQRRRSAERVSLPLKQEYNYWRTSPDFKLCSAVSELSSRIYHRHINSHARTNTKQHTRAHTRLNAVGIEQRRAVRNSKCQFSRMHKTVIEL